MAWAGAGPRREVNPTPQDASGAEPPSDAIVIFGIDHYLGNEAIMNLLDFRFANSFRQPIWNRNSVASVQITLAENFGIADRGAFYETAGASRDVVQNHLFQIVALLAIEPPPYRGYGAVHGEKAGVLQAMRPLAPADGRGNHFRFWLAPNSSFALAARVKRGGQGFVGDQRELYLCEHGVGEELAYERLLGDAMVGDGALFSDQQAVEAAWAVVDPVLVNHHPAIERVGDLLHIDIRDLRDNRAPQDTP